MAALNLAAIAIATANANANANVNAKKGPTAIARFLRRRHAGSGAAFLGMSANAIERVAVAS